MAFWVIAAGCVALASLLLEWWWLNKPHSQEGFGSRVPQLIGSLGGLAFAVAPWALHGLAYVTVASLVGCLFLLAACYVPAKSQQPVCAGVQVFNRFTFFGVGLALSLDRAFDGNEFTHASAWQILPMQALMLGFITLCVVFGRECRIRKERRAPLG